MALQTETSSSTTSTTTATSAASTSSSSGNTSFFNPNSSTPLVLAFLGIGLVAAGIILFLGWRRQQLARIWAERFDSRQIRRDVSRDSPKLWDLWTNSGEARSYSTNDSVVTAELDWGSVMVSSCKLFKDRTNQTRSPFLQFQLSVRKVISPVKQFPITRPDHPLCPV